MVNLPSAFAQIPRYQLLYSYPSPIEPLDNLSRKLASSERCGSPSMWIKRDDSNSGLAGGGSKMRKLEYVLPDAQAKNASVLISTGGPQSNHMRQVAAAAARAGVKTHLIPRDVHHNYEGPGNVQITELMSAERHSVVTDKSKVDEKLAEISQALREQGEKPYWIPSGASTHPLGGLGYARSAFEIAEQEAQLGVHFGYIFVACNSGSTLGGMIAGFKLLEQQSQEPLSYRKIVGVDTSAGNEAELRALVLRIARNTAARIGIHDPERSIVEDSVLIDTKWNARAYGRLDQTTRDTIKLLATTEGVLLDPVYTGKAFAGMLAWARAPNLQLKDMDQRNWLFVHTGGTTVLNAYPDLT